MLTQARFILYLIFLFFLAVWLGSAVFDSLNSHIAWYGDPIGYIRYTKLPQPKGMVNPWPFTTALLSVMTIACLFAFGRYRGRGRNQVLMTLIGTLVLLVLTFLYFVPGLIQIFGKTSDHSNEALIAMSRRWVAINAVRLLLLAILFFTGLVGLSKFRQAGTRAD